MCDTCEAFTDFLSLNLFNRPIQSAALCAPLQCAVVCSAALCAAASAAGSAQMLQSAET